MNLSVPIQVYDERRRAVLGLVNAMPHGTRQQISHDLRIHAVTISNVLNGTQVNERVLGSIIAWLGKENASANY